MNIIADGGNKQIEKFEKYKLKQENIGPPSQFVLECTVNYLYLHPDLFEVRKSIKKLKLVKVLKKFTNQTSFTGLFLSTFLKV